MKVWMLTASLSRQGGGLFDAVRHLALAMEGVPGCEVRVYGLRDGYTDEDRPAWGMVSVAAYRVKGPRTFGFAPSLSGRLQQDRPDLLHVHGLWMYPSLASLRWARRGGRPHVVSPQGMLDAWALRNSGWKKHIAGWLYERAHLKVASCLHALCEAEARAIRAYGLKNPVCVIPNGVDLPPHQSDNRPPWRGAVLKGAKVLLYLGRIHPKKGLVNLLRGWAKVAHTPVAVEWHLVTAGWDQGGHEAELKTLTSELGIAGRAHFVGPQFGEAKDASFRHADAFILPSFSEGLPMTVLEAWAYGLPVLMTPQCNLPEGFAAGAAILLQPDTASIARRLEALMSLSNRERQTMGCWGRELVRERYTWPRGAAEMRAVYVWLLGGGPKPSCVVDG